LLIDTHLHLDEKVDGTALGAVKELSRQLAQEKISRGVVLHLESQPWSREEVSEAVSRFDRLRAFVNIHPHSGDAKNILRDSIEKQKFIGLKLHPRLQEFSLDDERTIELVRFAGEIGVPVLIDAFPDGTALMQGFSPLKFAELAKRCPDTKIIWAHM